MTVVLVGIGADSTNTQPLPPVDGDGRFEYIPIPESAPTTESATYGTVPLRHGDGSLASALTGIDPAGGGEHTVTGDALANWPLHHDPHFAALTYGESPNRPAYTTVLETLSPGDCLAFYTGLAAPETSYTHRYVIGYFTVDAVYRLPQTDPASLLPSLAANAHLKRYTADTVAPGTVVIAGREPGGRLPRAVRISTHHGGGHHYLAPQYETAWTPAPSGNPDRPAYLGGIKQIHRCQVSQETFLEAIDPDRQAERTSPS